MSTPPVRTERHGDVAVIVIDHPPVNAFAQPVRSALLDAVVAADADPAVAAIVIHGAGRHFVAGADINAETARLEAALAARPGPTIPRPRPRGGGPRYRGRGRPPSC